MGIIPDFPPYDIDAIDTAGTWLFQVGADRIATLQRGGQQTSANVLGGPHGWDGTAADHWRAVVDARVKDLETASSAFIKLGFALYFLASDLRSAKQEYNSQLARLLYMHPDLRLDGYNPRPVPVGDEVALVKPLHDAIAQVAPALQRAAGQIAEAGDMADAITASGSPSGLPGVPAGTDRSKASLQLLTMLFGSLADDRLSGLDFQAKVLKDFGMSENFTTLKEPGWTRGTKPDGLDNQRMIEVKRTPYQWNSTQIKQQMQYARQNNLEYRLIMPKNGRISTGLATQMANNPNANWYTDQGNGVYQGGKDGKYYKVGTDGKMQETTAPASGSTPTGVEEVPPAPTVPKGVDPAGPDGPVVPEVPEVPVEPVPEVPEVPIVPEVP